MEKEFQQANLFELGGDGIQVTYSTSGLEGLPLFSYRNGNINCQFKGGRNPLSNDRDRSVLYSNR
jgi:hypothetical protein